MRALRLVDRARRPERVCVMGARCSSCDAAIVWVIMESGKRMPVDAESIRKGLVLNGDHTRGAMRDTGISHYATCPQAGKHRRS